MRLIQRKKRFQMMQKSNLLFVECGSPAAAFS
jgi:hypothetical protein